VDEPSLAAVVLAALQRVAPEVDPAALDPDVELEEQVDLDSMDFLNFVAALRDATGVEVPERDYPALTTLRGCARYLEAHRSP
jgi:acyl carrier protein